jgi:hypothetical protein
MVEFFEADQQTGPQRRCRPAGKRRLQPPWPSNCSRVSWCSDVSAPARSSAHPLPDCDMLSRIFALAANDGPLPQAASRTKAPPSLEECCENQANGFWIQCSNSRTEGTRRRRRSRARSSACRNKPCARGAPPRPLQGGCALVSCRLKVGQKLLTGGKHGRDVAELPLTGEHNCQVVTVSQNQTAVQKEEHGTYGDISAAHGLDSV